MVRVTLRRYVIDPLRWANGGRPCSGPLGYHSAEALVGVEDAEWERRTSPRDEPQERLTGGPPDFAQGPWVIVNSTDPAPYRGDRRWPTSCACGYVFAEGDPCQVRAPLLWRRADDPRTLLTLGEAPIGAMWFAWWMRDPRPQLGPHPLFVRLPNGRDWSPDMPASNCGRPGDAAHHCWVAHGTPPAVTVDKVGETCSAGAGSIGSGEGESYWHGYLRGGELATA